MKSALKRGGSADLNIYSKSGGGFLGWAYYPQITSSNQYGVLDGVVINYGSMPNGPIANYNLGYTATHEVGHYLGLPHTFEKGCIGHGDYIDDTPFMLVPTSGCPADGTKDTCTEARLRPDPQLHGLLVRHLLHGVHAGPGGADAEAVRPLAPEARLKRVAGESRPALPRLSARGGPLPQTLKRTFRTSPSATT